MGRKVLVKDAYDGEIHICDVELVDTQGTMNAYFVLGINYLWDIYCHNDICHALFDYVDKRCFLAKFTPLYCSFGFPLHTEDEYLMWESKVSKNLLHGRQSLGIPAHVRKDEYPHFPASVHVVLPCCLIAAAWNGSSFTTPTNQSSVLVSMILCA
ncbi:hypothetical protein VNO78_23828 [Psophocarpus tetragonolobus]|uniref:Uncharacterized protein n=1 Tax=Psophocarpus tetragonolobus TaxID=3891 RepID=A0AAN9S4B6_PSOTE